MPRIFEDRGKAYIEKPGSLSNCIGCCFKLPGKRVSRTNECSKFQDRVFGDDSHCSHERVVFQEVDPLYIALMEARDGDN